MDKRSALEFFVQDFAAWNAHDLDAAVAVTTEDVFMEGPAPFIPLSGVRGHAEYRTRRRRHISGLMLRRTTRSW